MDNKFNVWKAFWQGFWPGALSGLLIWFVFVSTQAHCATSAPRHDNSLGAVIEYTNPFVYNFGAIVDGAVIVDSKTDKRATNLRFQPFATFELYTEQILLCGNRAEDLRNATGPIVLTYKRVSHEMIEGVACHELQSVYHVQAKEMQ